MEYWYNINRKIPNDNKHLINKLACELQRAYIQLRILQRDHFEVLHTREEYQIMCHIIAIKFPLFTDLHSEWSMEAIKSTENSRP